MVTLTSSPPTTNSPITRILRIAPNIPYPRIQQPFLAKVFAVHVLDAPEAAGGDCALLRAVGDVHGGGGGLVGGEAQGAGCERAGEALEDGGHVGDQGEGEEDGDGIEEGARGELNGCGFGLWLGKYYCDLWEAETEVLWAI